MPASTPLLDQPARRFLAGLAAGALLVAAVAPYFAPSAARALPAATTAAVDTIDVTGTGSVTRAPDVADVRLGVRAQRPTAAAARSDAAVAMTAVLAALRRDGLAEADVQTVSLSLQPQYDYSAAGAPRLIGYLMQNEVAATVRDLTRLGVVVDDAVAAGATTVDGVDLRVGDPSAAERQARIAAIADARARADALAGAAGVSIVGVASITETSAPVPSPIPYAATAPRADAVQTPIQAGSLQIAVTVDVAYRIE